MAQRLLLLVPEHPQRGGSQVTWPWWATFLFMVGLCISIVLIIFITALGALMRLSIVKRHDVRRGQEAAWAEGYEQGIHDERTSADWTDGQYPPQRQNPYSEKEVK